MTEEELTYGADFWLAPVDEAQIPQQAPLAPQSSTVPDRPPPPEGYVPGGMVPDRSMAPPPEPDVESPEEMSDIAHALGNMVDTAANLGGGFVGMIENVGNVLEESIANMGAITLDEEGLSYRSPSEWLAYKEKYKEEASAVAKLAKALTSVDTVQAEDTWQDVKDAEGVVDTIKQTLLFAGEEFVPSLVHMAAMAVNLPGYMWARAGDLSTARAENDGRDTPNASDLALGLTGAVISGLMDRFGLDRIMKAGRSTSGFWMSMLKGARDESGTEAGQELVEYLTTNYGTDAGATVLEALDQMAAASVAAGPPGGVMAGGSHVLSGGKPKPGTTPPAADAGTEEVPEDGGTGPRDVSYIPEESELAADYVKKLFESEEDPDIRNQVVADVHQQFDLNGDTSTADDIIKAARTAIKDEGEAAATIESLEKKEAKAAGKKAKKVKNKIAEPKPINKAGEMKAFYNPRSTKNSILVPPGQEAGFEQLAKDSDVITYKVSGKEAAANGDPDAEGTWYAHDEEVIDLVKQGLYWKAQNHPAGGKPPGANSAVVARDADGVIVNKTATVAGSQHEQEALKTNEGVGETAEIMDPAEALVEGTVDGAELLAGQETTEEAPGPSAAATKVAEAHKTPAERVGAAAASNPELFKTKGERTQKRATATAKAGDTVQTGVLGKEQLGTQIAAVHTSIIDDAAQMEADGYDMTALVKSLGTVFKAGDVQGKAAEAGLTPIAWLKKKYVDGMGISGAGTGRIGAFTRTNMAAHLEELPGILDQLASQKPKKVVAKPKVEKKVSPAQVKAKKKSKSRIKTTRTVTNSKGKKKQVPLTEKELDTNKKKRERNAQTRAANVASLTEKKAHTTAKNSAVARSLMKAAADKSGKKGTTVAKVLEGLGLPYKEGERVITHMSVLSDITAYVVQGKPLPADMPNQFQTVYDALFTLLRSEAPTAKETKTAPKPAQTTKKVVKPAVKEVKQPLKQEKKVPPAQAKAKKVARKRVRSKANDQVLTDPTAVQERMKHLYRALTSQKEVSITALHEAAGPSSLSLDAHEIISLLHRITTEEYPNTENLNSDAVQALNVLKEKTYDLLDDSKSIVTKADLAVKGLPNLPGGGTSVQMRLDQYTEKSKPGYEKLVPFLPRITQFGSLIAKATRDPGKQVDVEQLMDVAGVPDAIMDDILELVSTASAIRQFDSGATFEDTFDAKELRRQQLLQVEEAEGVAEILTEEVYGVDKVVDDFRKVDKRQTSEEQFAQANKDNPEMLKWYKEANEADKKAMLEAFGDLLTIDEDLGYDTGDAFDPNDPDYVQTQYEGRDNPNTLSEKSAKGILAQLRKVAGFETLAEVTAAREQAALSVLSMAAALEERTGKRVMANQLLAAMDRFLDPNDSFRLLGDIFRNNPNVASIEISFSPLEYARAEAKLLGTTTDTSAVANRAFSTAARLAEAVVRNKYIAGMHRGVLFDSSVVFINTDSIKAAEKGNTTKYGRNPGAGTVTTLFHELVHAMTATELSTNPAFLHEITGLMQEVRDATNESDKLQRIFMLDDQRYRYMMSSPEEFIAVAMTDNGMMRLLSSIDLKTKAKWNDGRSMMRTIMDKFINAVTKYLSPYGVVATPHSVFSHLVASVHNNTHTPDTIAALRRAYIATDSTHMMRQPGVYAYKFDDVTLEVTPSGGIRTDWQNLQDMYDNDLAIGEALEGVEDRLLRVEFKKLLTEQDNDPTGYKKTPLKQEVKESGANISRRIRRNNRVASTHGNELANAVDSFDEMNTGSRREAISTASAARVSAVGGKSRRAALGMAMLDQIQRMYNDTITWHDTESGKWVKPVEDVITSLRNRFAYAKEQHKKNEHLLHLWNKVDEAEGVVASDFMRDSTMNEVDGSISWSKQDAAVKSLDKKGNLTTAGQNRKTAHAEMETRWKALNSAQKDIYRQSLKYFRDSVHDKRNAIIGSFSSEFGIPAKYIRIFRTVTTKAGVNALEAPLTEDGKHVYPAWGKAIKSLNDINSAARVVGPYFPSMRFGDYAVYYITDKVDKLFKTEKEARDHGEQWKEGDWTRRYEVKENQAGDWKLTGIEDTFELYESEYKANKEALRLQGKGVDAKAVIKTKLPPLNRNAAALLGIAQSRTDSSEASMAIYQSMLEMLPEGNINKQMMRRNKVKGVSNDGRRTLATYIESSGWQMAELRYGRDVRLANKLLADAENKVATKDKSMAADVAGEMSKRTNMAVESNSAFMGGVGKAGFIWHLLSVSYSMLNATQPFMVALPYLSGKFSGIRAAREMQRAYSDVLVPILQSVVSEAGGLRSLTGKDTEVDQLLDKVIANVKASGKEDAGRIADMLKQLGADGVIDASFTMMLHEASQNSKSTGMWHNMFEFMRVMPYSIEILNRTVTSIAAYRLHEREAADVASGNKAMHDGIAFSAEAVRATQFDYSNMNRPRYFVKNDWMRAATMFKIYPVGIYGLMADNINKSFKGDIVQKKAAMKTLAYFGVTTTILSGTAGVMIEPLRILSAMLAGMLPEDDEDRKWFANPDLWVREQTYELLINMDATPETAKKLTAVATYGLPNAAGMDLYNRVGLQSLLMQLKYDRDGTVAWMQSAYETALGPIFGKGATVSKAFDKLDAGQGMGGFTKAIAPKFIRDAWNAVDMHSKGLVDFSGTTILEPEKLSAADLLVQVIGFSPTKKSTVYHNRRLANAAIGPVRAEKTRLKRAFKDADTNADKMRVWYQKVVPFNKRLPRGYKKLTMHDLRSAVRRQGQQERATIGGVYIRKNDRAVVKPLIEKFSD